jgi:hypothetical protein
MLSAYNDNSFYRKADRIDILAAFRAGKNPPTKPMMRENVMAPVNTELVIEKLNDNSVNDPKFNVEIEKN